VKVIDFLIIGFSKQTDENLTHSFVKTTIDQTGLNALDSYPSSMMELVVVIDSIFGSVKITSITKEELLQKIMMNCLDFIEISKVLILFYFNVHDFLVVNNLAN